MLEVRRHLESTSDFSSSARSGRAFLGRSGGDLQAFRTTKSDTSFGGSQLHRGNDLVKSIREVNANQAFCICGHVPNSTRWASDSVAGGTLPWNLLHKPTERSFKLRLDLRSKRRRPVVSRNSIDNFR